MVETRDNAQDAAAGVDFEAIENEIDREIDSLFVPAAKPRTGAPGAAEISMAGGSIAVPGGGAAGSGKEPFDPKALDAEIDREIDALFVPVSREAQAEESGEAVPASPAPPEEPAGQPQAVEAGPETHEDFYPSGPSPAFRTGYGARDELPKLVEVFNAAYLSLDWEFSQQNIRKLQAALSGLEPFAGSAPQTVPIFKMLKVILARLNARPQFVNNQIIELIRESQGLLAHMLLMEEAPGPGEKERIVSLLGRFRLMREKAMAARETRPQAGGEEQAEGGLESGPAGSGEKAKEEVARPPDRAEDLTARSPRPEAGHRRPKAPEAPMPGDWSLIDLRDWMKASGRSLAETIEGLEAEINRLRKVETVLGKSAGLAPVVEMLAGIRAGMEFRVGALREQGGSLNSRAAWVENLEKVLSACEAQSVPSAEKGAGQAADAGPPAGRESRTRREDLCLFRYCGRSYGVFFPNMVKYSRISRKVADKIRARGYATLDDVKPFLRNVRNGVLGEWAAMPRRTLQALRFRLIGPSVFQAEKAPADLRMAIFLNLGDDWGVVLSDSDRIDFRAEMEIKEEECSCQAALGIARTESGLCAEVLDPARVADMAGESVEQ